MISAAPGAAESAATVRSHLLEFCVLVGCEDGLEAIVAGGHEGFHLPVLFLRQEVVVVMDGLGLITNILLTGFDLGYLIVSQVECQTEAFEAGGCHDLTVVIHSFAARGEFLFLLGGQEGLHFSPFVLVEGDEAVLILS